MTLKEKNNKKQPMVGIIGIGCVGATPRFMVRGGGNKILGFDDSDTQKVGKLHRG